MQKAIPLFSRKLWKQKRGSGIEKNLWLEIDEADLPKNCRVKICCPRFDANFVATKKCLKY